MQYSKGFQKYVGIFKKAIPKITFPKYWEIPIPLGKSRGVKSDHFRKK